MSKILIINVNWIGDVLFSTPFIKAIRKANPNSYIACMVVPRCKEILEDNPHLDKLIIYDEDIAHKDIFGKMRLISSLRSEKFQRVFVLHKSLTRTLIATLSKIPVRIGYSLKKRNLFLTIKIPQPQIPIHRVEYFLNIAAAAGIDISDKDLVFQVPPKDIEFAQRLLKEAGIKENEKFVVINPGGNWMPKRWPHENFAKLADNLVEKYDVKVVITGAPKDTEVAKTIASIMKHKPIILAGKTTLKQLGAVLKKASLVISNDTGPMHVAVSQKTPTIALFGPTSKDITGPYGKSEYAAIQKDIGCIIPCYNLKCKDNKCIKAIEIKDIIKVIDERNWLGK